MHQKFYFFTLIMFLQAGFVFGQTQLEIALKHIEKNAKVWSLNASDYANMQVSSSVTSNKGITYLYLNQTYDNIPVRNAMMTVIITKNGEVVSVGNSFMSDLKSKISHSKKSLQPENAVLSAAEHLGINVKSRPLVSSRNNEGKYTIEMPEFTKSPIPAELKYDLKDDKLVLVWNLNLDMKSSADYWDINIDAADGSFVSKHNFTTYCKHHKDAYAKHENCSLSTFKKLIKNTHKVSDVLVAGSNAAKYNVIKLPAESPNHGGRAIATDDQFAEVSPYGWHDTNGADGAEFVITKGNNVYAYQDKNDDDESDGPETDGGTSLNFDFPMDLTNDARQSADASVTNLFYMVNMMHDVTATLGFTEEFGNFQKKNYSGKALDGEDDYVLAQAFDGITLHEAKQDLDASGNPTKINNANFSTPADGFNGRMQMYFWDNDGGAVSIDSPESIKGFVAEYGTGQFGGVIPENTEPPISGAIAIAKDGSTNPTACCGPLVNGAEVSGNIALIDRGLCDFSNKVYRAQQSGAIAAIICNVVGVSGGNGEEVLGMSGALNAGLVTIPSIFMKKSDCDKIRLVIDNGGTVTMTLQSRERVGAEFLDGALDNGIIAHEFGHGISTRLTGGRNNSSCLSNDEQMGEGWSDFFALVMTHEVGDKGTDSRGIGTFAAAQLPSGSGIRRYPYSTDMKINPQTFDNIKGTTAPHPLGEVWVDALWDMYWAFIDQYGYNPDWKNETSGNHRAVFLVLEGMKMQTCNPGFIQGRDAILMADKIHFASENKCLIWRVFARRGLGYFANGGLTTNRNDGVENFETLPTCIQKLKISKTATSSVNAGDEINIELNTINHIPSRQTNVVISDELPDGLTYVNGSGSITPIVSGNKLTFSVGDMDFEKAINLTYKVKTSVNNKSLRIVFDDFEDFTWDIGKNEGSEDWGFNSDLFRSPDYSLNMINVAADVDAFLVSTPYLVSGANPVMRFWHQYNTQAGFDGGFVEVSVDGGTFEIIKKNKFIRNTYNSSISYGTLAIPALEGFTGKSAGSGWVDSYIDLSDYRGKSCVFRFRFASDATIAASGDFTGWFIDDFELLDIYKYVAQACISADQGLGEKACTDATETFINSDGTVSATDINKDYFSINVTPNPASDFINISASSTNKISTLISITSSDGRSVYNGRMFVEGRDNKMTINTSGFLPGFYVVKIQSGENVSLKKFIIK